MAILTVTVGEMCRRQSVRELGELFSKRSIYLVREESNGHNPLQLSNL